MMNCFILRVTDGHLLKVPYRMKNIYFFLLIQFVSLVYRGTTEKAEFWQDSLMT